VSRRALRAVIAALALAGAAITAYLVYVRHTGSTLVCSSGGCETVQSSPYAELAGIPVAALALVAFLAIGATALSASPVAAAAGAALALGGLVFSAYLLVVQAAVIDAVCDWCLASDAVLTALAAAAVLRLRAAPAAAATPGR
jgi:uncharacterized membrane protein